MPKYDVESYLLILSQAERSEQTIKNYRKILVSYAKFLNVPLDQVHDHLSVTNLLKYAGSRKGKAASSLRTNLSILHRYHVLNGVVFDELEYNVFRRKAIPEENDKPIDLKTLQQMMDITDAHGRAIITFLISTGARAGESCKILLSDVKNDVVTIRPEIAKGRHGGNVYLTSEARQYLDVWLKERDHYLSMADLRMKGLVKSGGANPRPVKDDRLFGVAYSSLHKIFSRLYNKVDGEQGKYGAKCTPHSCRKYFRTHAVKTMPLDLVEGIMRHTGYLSSVYVRMSEEERRAQFHKGESALYITKADFRVNEGEMREMKKRIDQLENALKNAYSEGKSFVMKIPKDEVIEE